MVNALFVNSSKANCSIYESGLMIYNILKQSKLVNFDYLELTREDCINKIPIPKYDLYVLNYHHWSLPLDHELVTKLPGTKISIVLEVDEKVLLPYTPDIFDIYMMIDPSTNYIKPFYSFPRPLEVIPYLRPLYRSNIPIIGSFGLLTPGKNFEELVLNANNIGRSIVRINLPPVTYMGDIGIQIRLVEYANMLKRLAKRHVQVIVTHDYMTKPELVRWCSQNTINVFPYYRNQPGLAAVTDQAISSGRGLVVTSCNTFRHIHKYISSYPQYSYMELAVNTLDGVKKMQQDWHPDRFLNKFDIMLKDIM